MSGVEGILQDDGGRLAVDARPVLVALVARRWTAGATALHRSEPRLGDMAAQPLIVQGDGDMVAQTGPDVFHPRSGQRRLGTLVPGRIDGQPDHELGDLVGDR